MEGYRQAIRRPNPGAFDDAFPAGLRARPGPQPADELVWSHAKRTGVARSPLRKGEKLRDRVDAQLHDVAADPALVQSFFRHPSGTYISAC